MLHALAKVWRSRRGHGVSRGLASSGDPGLLRSALCAGDSYVMFFHILTLGVRASRRRVCGPPELLCATTCTSSGECAAGGFCEWREFAVVVGAWRLTRSHLCPRGALQSPRSK